MHNYAWKEDGIAVGDEKETLNTEIPARVRNDFVEFEALEQNRLELFDRIEKETSELAPYIRQTLVTRVIEHSPKDGVALASLLGLPPAEIMTNLLSNVSSKKHFEFAVTYMKAWDRNFSYISLEEAEKVRLDSLFSRSIFSDIKSSAFDLENKWLEGLPVQVRPLAEAVDNYYAQFLARRKFIPIDEERELVNMEPFSPRGRIRDPINEPTKTEKSGERVLRWLDDAMRGSYYSDPVRKALWQKMFGNEEYDAEKLESTIEKLQLNQSVAHDIMHEPLVPKTSIQVVILTYDNPKIRGSERSKLFRRLDAGDSEVINQVKGFLSSLGPSAEWKPYNVMVKGEASHAQSTLIEELDASLVTRYGEGVKIILNPETGKYEVKDERSEAETRIEQKRYKIDDFYFHRDFIDNGGKTFHVFVSNYRKFNLITVDGTWLRLPRGYSVNDIKFEDDIYKISVVYEDKKRGILTYPPKEFLPVPDFTPTAGELAVYEENHEISRLYGFEKQFSGLDNAVHYSHPLVSHGIPEDIIIYKGVVLELEPETVISSVRETRDGKIQVRCLGMGGHVEDKIFNLSDCFSVEQIFGHINDANTERNEVEVMLTKQEQRDLELLNLLAEVQAGKFDRNAVFDYFMKHYPTNERMSQKNKTLNFVAHSKGIIKVLNDTLREKPKLFLNTMGAKEDNISDAYAEHLLLSLFPEIRTNREQAERAEKEKSGRFGRGIFGREALAQIMENPEVSARALLSGAEYTAFEGADPMSGNEVEVMRLRETTTGMLVSGIYGRYNSSSRKWEKIPLDLSKENSGATREITMEIPNTRGLHEVVLPRLNNGQILPDRIKGVDQTGKEVTLETKINRFGESVVTVLAGIQRILYSQTEDLVPKVPTDCRAEEYEKFKRQLNQAGGEVLTEKLARLPDDVKLFLNSLRSRPPKEQVQAVEAFVRRYGYYDFDNSEVIKEKEGKSLEEIFSIMEIRLQELRRRSGQNEILKNKKYAGVCADFALFSSAMMRELGLPSGVISGFRLSPGVKSVTTKHAHGIAFALWPGVNGKAEIIEVDGTPHGVNDEQEALLAAFRKPSLLEKEELTEQMSQMIFRANEVKLREFEKILAENDLEKIKSLSNGELEGVLNALLANVHEPHYHIIQTILNAGRYGGFDVRKFKEDKDLETELAFQHFLENEITRERKTVKDVTAGAKFSRGSELLNLIHEFAERYVKDGKGNVSQQEAFEILKKIIETAGNKLDPLEARATIASIQYLEALKI